MLEGKGVIWSFEHRAYWRANRAGYCAELMGAGVYDLAEAEKIAADANSPGERREEARDALLEWQAFMERLQPGCLLRAAVDELQTTADNLANQWMDATIAAQQRREAMEKACDLLAERTHGNPARSPAHNARLVLESVAIQNRPTPAASDAPC